MTAPQAAAPVAETIADVLSSDNLDAFRDAPEGEPAVTEAPIEPKPSKAKSKTKSKLAAKAGPENEPGDEPDENDEPTKPDGEPPPKPLPDNEEAEAAAFSDDALATPEGVAAAREIVRAARAAADKRNAVLDRYDMRSKNRMREAEQLKTQVDARSAHVENVVGLITRDLRLFRERGVTAKEKLAALERLDGTGRAGHEILDELTAGILSDGKEQPRDPHVRELERRLAESDARWDTYLQQQQAQQIQGQTNAQKRQIAQVYTAIQEAAVDAEEYPAVAEGIENGDWTPEEVAELVAGEGGIMVSHFKAKQERLDKLEALRILEGRLARRRGTVERAPQGETGAGAVKKPGSPARGAGRGTTITPSVADRSTGSRRELETREERLADLQRDQAALKQMFPMLG